MGVTGPGREIEFTRHYRSNLGHERAKRIDEVEAVIRVAVLSHRLMPTTQAVEVDSKVYELLPPMYLDGVDRIERLVKLPRPVVGSKPTS